jgi:hypothetical protein
MRLCSFISEHPEYFLYLYGHFKMGWLEVRQMHGVKAGRTASMQIYELSVWHDIDGAHPSGKRGCYGAVDAESKILNFTKF